MNKNGFGPRRKKRDNEEEIKDIFVHLAHMPLWCWKIYVNCAVYKNHVCCPVMHKEHIKDSKNVKVIRNNGIA